MPYNADGDCVRNVKSGFKTCICMVNVLSCIPVECKRSNRYEPDKSRILIKITGKKEKRKEKKKKLLFRLKTLWRQ